MRRGLSYGCYYKEIKRYGYVKAKLAVNRNFATGNIDPRLYGSFAEHVGEVKLMSHTELYSDDLKLSNSSECENITAHEVAITDTAVLKKHSWNMLKYSY